MSSADQNSSAGGQSGSVDVTDLDIPQLQDVRRQLEQELQHLTQSFGQLKAAQTKFKTCVEAIDGIKAKGAFRPIQASTRTQH
jgi:prefoldin alpha subunit